MHLTCAQSTSSALACLTCPVNPPMTTTAMPAHTPISMRQYDQETPSGRLRTLAAYRLAICARAVAASATARAQAARSRQGAGAELLQHLGHQRRDRRTLAAQQRDVGEQRVALQLLDDGRDAVVAADPQVVTLGHVVGEHHAGPGAEAGQHG